MGGRGPTRGKKRELFGEGVGVAPGVVRQGVARRLWGQMLKLFWGRHEGTKARRHEGVAEGLSDEATRRGG